MTKTQAWLRSLRLRTLPLSSSGAILGNALAYQSSNFSWLVAVLLLWTVIILQIIANFANDLGDSQKGTDNANRKGPQRSVQSGIITQKQMQKAIITAIIIALLSGIYLLHISIKELNSSFFILLLIGILGIISAIKYTMGKKAYGYYGLGDFFVLLFFGWIPVGIAYFLQTQRWDYMILLPGLAVGLLSVAVLNLNNLRDYENDKICGKRTLIVNMGIFKGKIYHTLLIIVPFISMLIYSYYQTSCTVEYLYTLSFIPLIINIFTVWLTQNTIFLDRELKKVAISTFLMTILFWIGMTLC